MKVAALLDLLSQAKPDDDVHIDVKPWDEGLNVTTLVAASRYDEVEGAPGFILLQPSTEGATRLDPAGVN